MMVYADKLEKYLFDLHQIILTSIAGTSTCETDAELHTLPSISVEGEINYETRLCTDQS
jgi:hypothetical protein